MFAKLFDTNNGQLLLLKVNTPDEVGLKLMIDYEEANVSCTISSDAIGIKEMEELFDAWNEEKIILLANEVFSELFSNKFESI